MLLWSIADIAIKSLRLFGRDIDVCAAAAHSAGASSIAECFWYMALSIEYVLGFVFQKDRQLNCTARIHLALVVF